MTTLCIGHSVRHVIQPTTGDKWVGVIVGYYCRIVEGGQQKTSYDVRWIGPDGNPTNNVVTHEVWEIEPA